MPVAVGLHQPERFDLKSLPEGFVVIRRMNQGEKMARQGHMAGMKVKGSNRTKDFEGELALANQRVTEFEFATTVVEHNLEDEGGRLLDFRNKADLAKLDGRVGEEIGIYIDKVNQFRDSEEEEDLGGSPTGSDQP